MWLLGGLAVWFALATLVAVVAGRAIRVADRRARQARVLTTADLPAGFVPAA